MAAREAKEALAEKAGPLGAFLEPAVGPAAAVGRGAERAAAAAETALETRREPEG